MYDRHIIGSLLEIFGNFWKMFGNDFVAFGQLLENLREVFDYVSCFHLHLSSCFTHPKYFTTEQSTVEAS